MKYFRLLDDLDIQDRWFIGKIDVEKFSDIWQYTQAKKISLSGRTLNGQITSPGEPLDITMAEFEVLIANEKASEIFSDDEVQKIPFKIDGIKQPYFIIQILNEIDCIDEERSEFKVWEKGNAIRPDLEGNYKSFLKLIVSPEKINKEIFRVKKFDVAVIVSDNLRKKILDNSLTGVRFREVTI